MNRYEEWLSYDYEEVIGHTFNQFICVYVPGGTLKTVKDFIQNFIDETGLTYKRAKIIMYYHIGNLALNARYYISMNGLISSYKRIEKDKIFTNSDEIVFYELKNRVLSRQEANRNKYATAKNNGFDNRLSYFKELFHYTDEEVARKIRMTVERYKAIENNPMIMQISDLLLLCDLYNISPNDLLSFKAHYTMIMSEVFDEKK